jgi:hypothetical protein
MNFPYGPQKRKRKKKKERRRGLLPSVPKTLEQLCWIKAKVHADGTASSSALWNPDR